MLGLGAVTVPVAGVGATCTCTLSLSSWLWLTLGELGGAALRCGVRSPRQQITPTSAVVAAMLRRMAE